MNGNGVWRCAGGVDHTAVTNGAGAREGMGRRKRSGPPSTRGPAASGAASSPHLPEAGKVVSVGFVDVSQSWRTRVELVDGTSLTLVAPTRALGDAIVPEVGRPVVMGWATTDGYFEAECTFVSTGVDTVVTWVLAARRIERMQRRAAFRIEASGPVTLRIDGSEVEGRLRNLSEGGLCCALPASLAPEEGAPLEVVAELEELGTFETPATVVRTPPGSETGQVEIGVAFTGLSDADVEDLRQYVFAEQLRRRRAMAGR